MSNIVPDLEENVDYVLIDAARLQERTREIAAANYGRSMLIKKICCLFVF